jgi:leucine-rich repeat kinase 2
MTEPTKQTYWYCGLYSYWSPQEYYLIEQSQKKKNEFDITVPNSTMGIRLLCSVVDNVESLIDEWFPGLRNIDIESGDTLVLTSALCPFCPAYNVHTFPIKQLQKESINNDEVTCPVHNGPVSLKLLSPDIIISDLGSKYHILRKDIQMDENSPSSLLGKGGFGEVYKAIYDNRTVAVKLFYPHMAEMHNTTPNQLIRQEISILSQLDHPYIIRLEGVCLRPKPMMILEFAGLGSLTSFSPYSNVSSNLKHRIMLQIVSALAFLHKNKVIYRDLKPGNILIFSINLNEAVNAKLSDYGISTYVTAAGTSQDIGTAGYKAPELLKAKTSKMPYTNKVDIYSLGIVLFELITNGHTPFEELSPLERDKAIEENRFIKNPAYYGCAPWPDMYDMIEHCLQYIPSKRPTAQEMFDRMCYPEFVALRQVIHIHDDWEILTFTVRKSHDNKSEIWLSSCDESQQSMLTVINLSQRTKQPQGKIIEQNSAVCCIVAVGQLVLLGTSLGDILVFESYDKKEHRLAPLPDSVLCFCYVKKKNEKSYLFAGLANGGLAVFNYEVLTTPKSKHEVLLSLNKGPVKAIKKYHSCLYVISGLEVIVIKLFPIAINFKWTACEE